VIERDVTRRRLLMATVGSTAAAVLAACTGRKSATGGLGSQAPGPTDQTATTSAAASPTPTPQPNLLWAEEFDSFDLASSVNPNGRWRPNDVWQPIDQGYADFGAGGHQCWLASPEQSLGGTVYNPFAVADSVLTISATRTPAAALAATGRCPWIGGTIVSNTNRPDMTFGYGYYEFRARFPIAGRGMFPALWFFAARGQNSAANKDGAEIDLLEVFGFPTGQPWTSGLHMKDARGQGDSMQVLTLATDTAGWHTYGLDWTESKLDFYYDREVKASITGPSATYFAGCKMAIRVDYSMNAQFFGAARQSDATTPAVLSLDVDYIRQYDRPF
jgi:beta-glucanase (GH16 family)